MIHRIFTLIWKELLAILRDPKSRFAILIPPIIQLFIFTFAATLDVKNIPIGILNRDNGEQAFELIQRFRGAPVFTKIVYLQSVEEITPFIDNQKGFMVLSIDQQFSRNIDAGKHADVQLILDGRKSNTTQIVAGYATAIINQFSSEISSREGLIQQNIQLFPRNWFNPNLLYYWYNIPSLVAILSMLACLVVTTQSIARERELGTFDQLLVSPMMPVEIAIGKMVPGVLIGIVESFFMLLVGVYLFQVPFVGSISLLLFSLFIFVCAISGVGLFISSLCNTQQQAFLGTFVFMVPAVLLAGFATPIENMPTWLQPVSYIIPLKYMLVISKGLFLKGITTEAVLNNSWPMAIIAIFTLFGAGIFFKKKLQ